MQSKISFENSDGQALAGILHTPEEGPARAAALFAHCFTCTKNITGGGQYRRSAGRRGYRGAAL